MRTNKCFKCLFKLILSFSVIIIVTTILNDFDLAINKLSRESDQFILSEIADTNEWKQIENSRTPSLCAEIPDGLVGPIRVAHPSNDFDAQSNNSIEINRNYRLSINGSWQPTNCIARHRIAIVIPYKDRPNDLNYFLVNMHPFLQKQQLEYQIFVAEQSNDQLFNKGILMNAAFLEAMSLTRNKSKLNRIDFENSKFKFDCVVFHDVDLLPEGNYFYINEKKQQIGTVTLFSFFFIFIISNSLMYCNLMLILNAKINCLYF